MLVTLAIIAPQPEYQAGFGWAKGKDDGKIERIEIALSQNESKSAPSSPGEIQFALLMPTFVAQLDFGAVILRQEFSLLDQSFNFEV
jgi:hypothetical protein